MGESGLDLRKTHIYDFHVEHGNIVDFGGYAMPVWYDGIIAEHKAVRESVGIFDTCHMGRTMAVGSDVERWLNRVVTNNVSKLEVNGGLYTVMCRPHGGIIDDLITYKIADDRYYIVYNAGTRVKDFTWFKETSEGFDVELTDHSDDIAMMAVQGPRAIETVNRVTEGDISRVPRFSIAGVSILGYPGYVTRTGYTGEDGFEVYVLDSPLDRPGKALDVWNALVDAGAKPCGLGSRDSLRLEAGLNLYGNDIDEGTTPLEAKLRWVVKFKKPGGFIGREALLKAREAGLKKTQVGLLAARHVAKATPYQRAGINQGEKKMSKGNGSKGCDVCEKKPASHFAVHPDGRLVETPMGPQRVYVRLCKFCAWGTAGGILVAIGAKIMDLF